MNYSRLAALPAGMEAEAGFAMEYALACVKLPGDAEERVEAVRALSMDALNKKLLLNVEARTSPPAATLLDPATNQDLGKVTHTIPYRLFVDVAKFVMMAGSHVYDFLLKILFLLYIYKINYSALCSYIGELIHCHAFHIAVLSKRERNYASITRKGPTIRSSYLR